MENCKQKPEDGCLFSETLGSLPPARSVAHPREEPSSSSSILGHRGRSLVLHEGGGAARRRWHTGAAERLEGAGGTTKSNAVPDIRTGTLVARDPCEDLALRKKYIK